MAGRRFVGFDLNPDYAEIAGARIQAWDEGRVAPGVPPEAFGEWLGETTSPRPPTAAAPGLF